jgi:protein-export membrane protein SecD
MTKNQIKWSVLLLLCVGAVALLYPTINWYSLEPAERARQESYRLRPKFILNLGLDLRGGTHMLMELDVSKLDPKADVNDALARAIEIIRNRVDQFGVAEPLIVRQGLRWIVVQLPGITNSEQAKELVGKTALLEFRMVDESESGQKALGKIAELGVAAFEGGKVSPAAAKLVPENARLYQGKESALYLLKKEAALTGAALDTARVETAGGDYGLPVVAFKFKPEAAGVFANLTGANVGKHMAIVLDDIVYSAPVIKSRISGGSGIIEGQFTADDARNLAIVLRAGALPAPVNLIEERTVGPSLGEDSIRAGLTASLVGLSLVMIFMLSYYRLSGLVACGALSLNILFLLACMAYFKATLTLPGIAGMILAMAMAVDANVLIFERIREELRLAKPVRLAVDHGYDRALSAILDGNLTTILSAVFLFQFGTGPIKGFAVTLILGLCISMLTAIYVTRLIFESYLSANPVEELSI